MMILLEDFKYRKSLILSLCAALFFVIGPQSFASEKAEKKFDHAHTQWNEILQKNVQAFRKGQTSRLKYGTVDKGKLNSYIQESLKVNKKTLESWSKNQQMAFYFNLYNALTVQRILTKFPKIKSIKELGTGFPLFKSAWKVKFFKLFGEEAYLDKIEHELVRESGKYKEPRVHFAFNCASIGCPALLDEAFVAERLDKQLETAFINFLSDKDRNRYNPKKKVLEISMIFKWYGGDFEKGHRGFSSLKDVFAKYAKYLTDDIEIQKFLQEKKVPVKFLDYDWNLNKI